MAVATESSPSRSQGLLDESRVVIEKAHRALNNSHYMELRRLACDFHDGVLTLHGRVSSFYLKQVAQTVVKQIVGVRKVVNDLDVRGI
jgi:osmotically-inducible protein OsmY